MGGVRVSSLLPWSAADIVGLHVEARNAPMGAGVFGPFELEIDWVRLEGAR